MARQKLKRHEAEEMQTRIERLFYSEFIENGIRGQVLPSVNELMERYDASFAMLRKFYKRLQDEGVIRTESRKGSILEAPERFQFQYRRQDVLIGVIGYIDENHPLGPFCGCAQILDAMERLATNHGWRVRFFNNYPDVSNLREDVLFDVVKTDLDVVLVEDPRLISTCMDRIMKLDIPVLVTESPVEGTTCITFDNHQIGHLATNHLLETGHRKIAFAGPIESFYWAESRGKGFEDALRAKGIDVDESWSFRVGRRNGEGADELVDALKKNGFTAVFCACDDIAKHLLTSGFENREYAIVGVDDKPDLRGADLTTIQKYPRLLGEAAFKVIVDHFEHGMNLPEIVKEPGVLIKRGSTMNNMVSCADCA